MTSAVAPGLRWPAVPFRLRAELLAIAAVMAVAAVVQTLSAVNTDVSWLLTVGERWLSGERPYVDIVEVNPPASILLSMPAVIAARFFKISPETAMLVLMLAGALLSAAFSVRIAAIAGLVSRTRVSVARVTLLALLTLLPTGDFGEREHVAAIAILPLLTAVAARVVGGRPEWAHALLAGFGGGLATTIKPMFGLALVGPLVLLLVRRGWRAAFEAPELHLAWMVPAIYGALVPFIFPAFTTDVLHRVLVAYVPFRQPLIVFLLQPVTFVAFGFGALALLVEKGHARSAFAEVLLLASLGFEGAFLLQGKAWHYQVLPAILLAAAAVLVALMQTRAAFLASSRERVIVASATCLAALAALSFSVHSTMSATIPGLEAAIVAAKPQPTLMALSSDIAVGHPLARDVGGRWVGTYPSQWITRNAERLEIEGISPERGKELNRLSREEQAAVARDLATRRPDIVLVDGAFGGRYISEHPTIAAQMDAYEEQGTFGPIALFIRKHEP